MVDSKAISYQRAGETRNQKLSYDEKFSSFHNALAYGKTQDLKSIVIAQP